MKALAQEDRAAIRAWTWFLVPALLGHGATPLKHWTCRALSIPVRSAPMRPSRSRGAKHRSCPGKAWRRGRRRDEPRRGLDLGVVLGDGVRTRSAPGRSVERAGPSCRQGRLVGERARAPGSAPVACEATAGCGNVDDDRIGQRRRATFRSGVQTGPLEQWKRWPWGARASLPAEQERLGKVLFEKGLQAVGSGRFAR